ncbi:MAG: heavy metal-associated domain-containing protein [Hyphomonadaceae bacterium]|nr:heavy metal-associated domain-containing protein [Hyphomonadaceae bacterium]
MNFLRNLAVALALTAAIPAPALAQTRPAQNAPIAADVVIAVNGLVCDFCAQAIDRSFRRRAEVNNVQVDLTAKLVSVDFKPSQNLTDDVLRDIITRAGYTVTTIRRTATP